MSKKFIIGIAGGSGSGKSTLAYGLQDLYPDIIEVVHFDDYQKNRDEVPITWGMKNWDHSDTINFDKLLEDLKSLKEGKDVEVMTKSEKHNPKFRDKGRIPHKIISKRIIIVEGYMALCNEKVRNLFDYSVYLDLDSENRMQRRTKFIKEEYTKKILLPSHDQFIEPSKKHANIVINTNENTKEEVLNQVLEKLKEKNIL